MSSNDLSERLEQLVVLAEIDEGAAYEIDQTIIAFDRITQKFLLLTASGCSCWNGEFDEEEFDSLYELEKSLRRDDRSYNPSLKGVDNLMEQVQSTFEGWVVYLDSTFTKDSIS